jgi:hypothetical protein
MWFLYVGPHITTESWIFAKKIGHGNLEATEGSISRWKDWNNIKFKRFHGEKSSADTNGADEWSLAKLPEILKKISPQDIYNVDETGLFYRAAPDGS